MLKSLALTVSDIFKKNHFVTAAAQAADIDDSIKLTRFRVSLKNSRLILPALCGPNDVFDFLSPFIPFHSTVPNRQHRPDQEHRCRHADQNGSGDDERVISDRCCAGPVRDERQRRPDEQNPDGNDEKEYDEWVTAGRHRRAQVGSFPAQSHTQVASKTSCGEGRS